MNTKNENLKVGAFYLATDTNTYFKASESDAKGAALANSNHLYKELKTIDCTPTWGALLPVMLDVFATLQAKKKQTSEQYTALMQLRKEFKQMALAADKWNEYCKASK
jgi:nitrate reductase assembly molybdenum cofactor insertion protein NarJ